MPLVGQATSRAYFAGIAFICYHGKRWWLARARTGRSLSKPPKWCLVVWQKRRVLLGNGRVYGSAKGISFTELNNLHCLNFGPKLQA